MVLPQSLSSTNFCFFLSSFDPAETFQNFRLFFEKKFVHPHLPRFVFGFTFDDIGDYRNMWVSLFVTSRADMYLLKLKLDSIRVARFFFVQNTKTGKNIPNDHKIYQKAIKYFP
jgi:hypothetical protein